MKKPAILGVFVLFLVLFLVGIVSAETLFLGTIYDGNYGGNGLSGVNVLVNCNNIVMSGNSEANGEYGVNFDSSCENGDKVSITLSKSGYVSRTFSGEYDGINLDDIKTSSENGNNVLIVNFVLIKQSGTSSLSSSSSSRGSSGSNKGCVSSLWDCSSNWSDCVNGIQTKTCFSNCNTAKIENQSCSEPNVATDTATGKVALEIMSQEPEDKLNVQESQGPGAFLSVITGAFIGTFNNGIGVFVIVFIVVVIIALGFVIIGRRNRRRISVGYIQEWP